MSKNRIKRFDEVEKLSFIELMKNSGRGISNIPVADVEGEDDSHRHSGARIQAPEYEPEQVKETPKPKSKEPKYTYAQPSKSIEMQIARPVRDLLGAKLFAQYNEEKKINPELTVVEFLRSEIALLQKHMKRMRGSDLSGAKTKERLLLAKLEDAESFPEDAMENTPTMDEMKFSIEASGIAIGIEEDHTRKSIKFSVPEDKSAKIKTLISGLGGKPNAEQFGPLTRYFGNGVLWRVYHPKDGQVLVAVGGMN